MTISKTIFKEYCEFPKIAWWHQNDKAVYTKILDKKYGAIGSEKAGYELEEAVLTLFDRNEVARVPAPAQSPGWYSRYALSTKEYIERGGAVIFQPAFLYDGLFCVCDLLLLNPEGKYDLVETWYRH